MRGLGRAALDEQVRQQEGLQMFARGTIRLLPILGLLAVAASVSAGGKHDSSTKRLTAAQCERLVRQLVNSGKPPFTDDYVLDLPRGVSESSLLEKQER